SNESMERLRCMPEVRQLRRDRHGSRSQLKSLFGLLGRWIFGVIARLVPNVQSRNTSRRSHLHLNLAPSPILRKIRRPIADDVFILQFNGNFLTNVGEPVAVKRITARQVDE